MASELLLSSIIPFAGSGLVGYAIDFALKKILKRMLIIVGLLAGMFFVGVQLLQKYGYVSAVNWDKLGNDSSTQV
ncbi:MAG: FUN14 domain-containing protein, partial [Candidatus Nitrosopolaris sp.]